MRKAKITYHAPEDDNEVVHMGGVRFIDGQEVEINSEEHPHLMSKLQNNQHFDVEMGEEVLDDKPKRGRPKTRDLKAGIEEARDHDFEADRREGLSGTRKPQGEPGVIGGTGTSPKPIEPTSDKTSAE